MAKGTRTKRRDGVSANTAAGTETESPILDSKPSSAVSNSRGKLVLLALSGSQGI